jgi:hypothetical protein
MGFNGSQIKVSRRIIIIIIIIILIIIVQLNSTVTSSLADWSAVWPVQSYIQITYPGSITVFIVG